MAVSPNLKRVWLYALLLALLAVTQPEARATTAPAEPLIISQDHAWPPLAFRDQHGKPQGILVDLWTELGRRLGRPIEFRLVDWPDSIAQVRDGRAQVHGGLFPSPERATFLDFTHKLIPMEAVVFVTADKRAATLEDPSLAPIGVIAGSYELEFLRTHYPGLTLREYRNNVLMVAAAVAGEIHAFAADHPVGVYLLSQHTKPGEFHVLKVLYRQKLVAAVPKGETELLQDIDAAIAELSAEDLARITNRWLHTETIEVMPHWLIPALLWLVLVVLLFMLATYLRGLRRQRSKLEQQLQIRTHDLKERGEQFQALFDNASVSVMVHDKDSLVVLEANARALESYGVDSVDALNEAAFESQSVWAEAPYTLADVQQWFARTRETGPQRFEWLTRSITGACMWEDVFLQTVHIGGIERIVSTSIDITARKQAESDLHRQMQLEELVRDISVGLLTGSSQNTNTNIARMMQRIGDFMQASRCLLFEQDRENGCYTLREQWCATDIAPRTPAMSIPVDTLHAYFEKLQRGEALVYIDRDMHEHQFEHQILAAGNTRSFLALPILRDGRLQEILVLSSVDEEKHWPQSDIKLLQVAADLIGGALARQRLEHDLEDLATHDSLTGLFNRRKLESLLALEIERAARYTRQFAIILFDIDAFKAVNDQYGHDTGDAVLREVAITVQQQLRSSDMLGRWGGEEFVVLLPEANAPGVQRVAETLRSQVAAAKFSGIKQLTISLGITMYTAGDTLDSILRRADQALYEAKAAGRNCAVIG